MYAQKKKRNKFAVFSRLKEEIIETHKMHDCKIIEKKKCLKAWMKCVWKIVYERESILRIIIISGFLNGKERRC